jgi:hypothetical protein
MNEIKDHVEKLWKELLDRPDRKMVERLFEKFRGSLVSVADSLRKSQPDEGHFATAEDLKRLEILVRSMNQDHEEAAAARKSTACLSCGRPYRMVTGAIQDEETLSILGAAPISHLTNEGKPCFVYGSDHELYYASSPRGKTFVAPPSSPGRAKAKQ